LTISLTLLLLSIILLSLMCRARHRWGPIPSDGKSVATTAAAAAAPGSSGGDGTAPTPKKRRRSRWDTAGDTTTNVDTSAAAGAGTTPTAAPGTDTSNATPANNDDSRALMLFPGEIVLSNGIKINLPPALTGRHPSGDPEVVKLHKELVDLDKKIRMNIIDLIPPEHERSPSPPPIYDSNGIRQNTREVRMKEKITRQRNAVIEELLKRDPTYQPPTDYKPEKKSRKLYIPYKEFPDYNFIGLIIGPRGNTHKRMQQDTNTVIAIRGKGSVKEGARGDYGDGYYNH
jgi:splicing factor 1